MQNMYSYGPTSIDAADPADLADSADAGLAFAAAASNELDVVIPMDGCWCPPPTACEALTSTPGSLGYCSPGLNT